MAKPSADARARRLALSLAAPGVLHFVTPKFFDAIVPKWMPGSARTTTYASGVVELAAAALVLNPKTRRVGAFVALATFIGVWPANIQSALDGGMKGAKPPMDSAAVAWIRVPFQLPMFWSAWKVAQSAK